MLPLRRIFATCLLLCASLRSVAAQSVVITLPAAGTTSIKQWDDITVEWTSSPEVDPTQQFDFYKCTSNSGSDCSGCTKYKESTLNDLKTILVTSSSAPWTTESGVMYVCMKSSTGAGISSYSGDITIPVPAITAPAVGPAGVAQYDEVSISWGSTGLGSKAQLDFYRCTSVPDVTVACGDTANADYCRIVNNDKVVDPATIENTGFVRVSSSSNDDYDDHADDAFLYSPGWTTDVGTFTPCMSLDQTTDGTPADPPTIFTYGTPYSVGAPSLDISKPNSKSCYEPYQTISMKWDSAGGGETLNLYKCKSRPRAEGMVTCESHPDCNTLSPAQATVANGGFAYLPSTQKLDVTGSSGNFFLCISSEDAGTELYSYSGKYTVADEDDPCPLSDGGIVGISIAGLIIFLCLLSCCWFAYKKYRSGAGSSSSSSSGMAPQTTSEKPVDFGNVYN